MRHGKKLNPLGRKAAHRKAMMANMACSLIEHKQINTTLAKAKALRGYIEPIITKAKDDSTHSRRTVFKYLQNKYAVTELFREVGPKVADRPGGYTRIIKLGHRLGDAAEMAMIELVDFNEIYESGSGAKKKTTRRSRRGGSAKKAATPQPVEEKVEPVVEDAVVEEAAVEEVVETKEEAKEEATEAPVAEAKEEKDVDPNTEEKKSEE